VSELASALERVQNQRFSGRVDITGSCTTAVAPTLRIIDASSQAFLSVSRPKLHFVEHSLLWKAPPAPQRLNVYFTAVDNQARTFACMINVAINSSKQASFAEEPSPGASIGV
jgi:hypothetical protein